MPKINTLRSARPSYPTADSKGRRGDSHPSDTKLDFDTPVVAMVWHKNGHPPCQFIMYPREDLRIRLSDHKTALAEVGFEQQVVRKPARFYHGDGANLSAWWCCTWDTPLRVQGPGDSILLCDSHFDDLEDFDIHAPHMVSADVSPSSQPRYTFDSLARRNEKAPADDLLDFDSQITLVLWLKDGEEPVQTIVYPREDCRVRLADNEADLEKIGLQKENVRYPRRYCRENGVGSWLRCAWDTPLSVSGAGDALVLSAPDVTEFKHFIVHEAHLLQL